MEKERPIVEISDGKLEGTLMQTYDGEIVYSFLGIPYGKPPIGEQRFRAPEPVEKWEGVRDATREGPKTVQREISISPEIEGSEDCLHLNVFTKNLPEENFEQKPVMVYFFGGRFRTGSNTTDRYSPDYVLLEDMVMVIPNFRLGLLGFLSLEDTSLDVPGNAALKDQNLALRWVQKNIARFGGDPNNVTLVGHSSGAVMTHLHLFSPVSRGLFQKVVLLSGSVLYKLAEIETFSLQKLSCVLNVKAETEEEILLHLRNLSGNEIIELQEKFLKLYDGRGIVIGPAVEKPNKTAFITDEPMELILNGEFAKIPILASYAANEELALNLVNRNSIERTGKCTMYPSEPEKVIPSIIQEEMDDESLKMICSEMERVYCNYNLEEKKYLLRSDSCFTVPLIASAKTHAELSDQPVYLMRWSIDDELNCYKRLMKSRPDDKGTAHGDELGYIFNMGFLPKVTRESQAEKSIRNAVHLLKNFCLYGNPSLCQNNIVSQWKPLQDDGENYLDFGNEITMTCFPEKKRMEVWQKIFECRKRNSKLSTFKVV